MRAGKGMCRSLQGSVAAFAILALGVSTYGAQIEFRVLSAPGGSGVGTANAVIPAGNVDVAFDVRISGWSPLILAVAQMGVDAETSLNFKWCQGNEDVLCNVAGDCPLLDLMPPGLPDGIPETPDLCVGSVYNQCGGTLKPLGYPGPAIGRSAGAFQITSTCNGGSTPGADCSVSQTCPGGGICVSNPDFPFGPGNVPVFAVATTTLNYGFAASATSTGNPGVADLGGSKHLGIYILHVSADAAGLYNVVMTPNPSLTFFLEPNGSPILPLNIVNGTITVTTGRCCSNIGDPAAACDDTCMTNGLCNALPAPRVFTAGALCSQGCPSCLTNADCADPIGQLADNLCTDNICTNFICSNPAQYNAATQCCNPAVGEQTGLTAIDDNDACTTDICNPLTGGVAHNASTGNACDDQFDCTVQDACDAGACVGVDVNTIPCVTSSDCPLGECGGAVAGFCECSEETPLCVLAIDKHCSISGAPCQEDDDCGTSGGTCVNTYSDPNCFDNGAVVNMGISIGAGSQFVTGGQFLVQYDPTCLDFVSIGPCAGDDIFTNIIQVDVDEVAGTIFYAVTSDPATQAIEGTPGPYNMACMVFTKTNDCDACDVCLIGPGANPNQNPRSTILSNDNGNRVPINSCGCGKEVRMAGDITLNTPPGTSVNADCGKTYADINWAAPSASDSCDGVLEVACDSQISGNGPADGLIMTGGRFAQGKYFFTCTASNSCGKSETNVWTVMVSDQHTIDVEVHLQPKMAAGVFSRAITFDLYNDCSSDPVTECVVIDFNGPMNFPGHGTATLKVDKGNFGCITAKDCLHTLRSTADIECVGNRWTAIFKGDPQQGGNWLEGGNLDGCKSDASYGAKNAINILDFGTFMATLANPGSYANGDTDCNTPHPHGDINADGIVDGLDYAFLIDNFLENSKGLCCFACVDGINDGQNCDSSSDCPGGACWSPNGPLASAIGVVTEISVKDLRAQGYGDAAIADLNKDGMLNLDDMALYMQGVMPEQNAPSRTGKGRGTR